MVVLSKDKRAGTAKANLVRPCATACATQDPVRVDSGLVRSINYWTLYGFLTTGWVGSVDHVLPVSESDPSPGSSPSQSVEVAPVQ